MYLMAIKSICRFLEPGRIVVVDDGSLTNNDRTLLGQHFPSLCIKHIGDVPKADTPVGGTWERLLSIADLVRDSYVIQIDSDSLTLQEIPEVLSYIAGNCSFTLLGAGSFPAVESMFDASNRAKRNSQQSMEPQAVSERYLDRFPDCGNLKYVRGCSGFAGFAQGSFSKADVEYFSKNLEVICGPAKWRQWGSEQVTSNLVVANSPRAGVLSYPKYASYYALPGIDYSQSSVLHFMGGHRFENGYYSMLARRVIRQLISGDRNRFSFEQGTVGRGVSASELLAPSPLQDDSNQKTKQE